MKLSHIATVAFLVASAISSAGAIGLIARQFTVERSAVRVVTDTAIVERMQGFADAIEQAPENQRHALLSKYGFEDKKALDDSLSAQRRGLSIAQQARAIELSVNDKRLTVLLAASGFSMIVAIMASIAFNDQVRDKPRRLRRGKDRAEAAGALSACAKPLAAHTK